MSTPLITVAMPLYNAERFLVPAVESILAQTVGDFELLVTDNASTDATQDLVRGWMRDDPRIRYERSDVNRGLAWNWNRAVPLARGQYFKWAAADDVHLPTFLERTLDRLRTDPSAVLAHSRTEDIDDDGVPVGEVVTDVAMDAPTPHERFHALTRRGWACLPTFGLIRLDVLRSTGLHGAYPRSDRALLAELGLHGRLVEVDEVLFQHREHAGRVTRATDLRTRYPVFTGQPAPPAPLPHWDLLAGYLSGLSRSDLPPIERARCLLTLADYVWMDKRPMLREVRDRVRHVAGRPGHRSSAPATDG